MGWFKDGVRQKLRDAAKAANKAVVDLGRDFSALQKELASLQKRAKEFSQVNNDATKDMVVTDPKSGKVVKGNDAARLIQEGKVEPTPEQIKTMTFLAKVGKDIRHLEQDSFEIEQQMLDLRNRKETLLAKEKKALDDISKYAEEKKKNKEDMTPEEYKEWKADWQKAVQSLANS